MITITQSPTIISKPSNLTNFPFPLTITLRSTNLADRGIKISTDDGSEYYSAEIDYSSDDSIVCMVAAPITHISVEGDIGDTVKILYGS